jgi:hypothetical protein
MWNLRPDGKPSGPFYCVPIHDFRDVPILFLSREFSDKAICRVDLSERFENPRGMDRNGARKLVCINVIQYQGFNIAVKDDSDEFSLAVDYWAAGIAANDIGRAHKIEGGR